MVERGPEPGTDASDPADGRGADGRIVVLGIGNVLTGDDALGPPS